MARPSTMRARPLTRAKPPPRSSSRRVITSKDRQAPWRMCRPSSAGSRSAPRRIDVVDHQIFQAGRPAGGAAERRCAAGWKSRTNGPPGEGIARGHCRCNRFLRRPVSPSRSARRAGSRRTFCACSSRTCCGISSHIKRKSRSIGTRRKPMARPGESSTGPA